MLLLSVNALFDSHSGDSGYSRLGSRGPSTVTLIARWYVATWGGPVNTVMVKVKLFPEDKKKTRDKLSLAGLKSYCMIHRNKLLIPEI